jgi:hypothetical protein
MSPRQPGTLHSPIPAAAMSYPGAPHLLQAVNGLVIFFTRLGGEFYRIRCFDGWH